MIVPGEVCGSDDLNEAMRALAMEHLRRETYLEDHKTGTTIENVIDSDIMPVFEREGKRSFSLANTRLRYNFPVRGLRHSITNHRIRDNKFILNYDDMEELFQPSLETIDTLMREQVYYAISNNIGIDKVVLAGGFGDSPALKEYLTNSLQSINNSEDKNMRLVCTPTHKSATGVAKGALMRAMNKDHGPKRIPVQSIGILHHVSDDPAKYPDEVLQQTDWDENDVTGEWYIMNTIQWLIKVVSHLLDQHTPRWKKLLTARRRTKKKNSNLSTPSTGSPCIPSKPSGRPGSQSTNSTSRTRAPRISTRAATSKTGARQPSSASSSSISPMYATPSARSHQRSLPTRKTIPRSIFV
jgi:hypothetical protein